MPIDTVRLNFTVLIILVTGRFFKRYSGVAEELYGAFGILKPLYLLNLMDVN
jgi:hypothetical protein